MLQHRNVEVQTAGIIQVIAAGRSECQPARRHKLRGIADKRTETFWIAERGGQSLRQVGIRRSKPETAGNTSIVSQRNSGISGAIDNGERRSRLIQSYSGNFP